MRVLLEQQRTALDRDQAQLAAARKKLEQETSMTFLFFSFWDSFLLLSLASLQDARKQLDEDRQNSEKEKREVITEKKSLEDLRKQHETEKVRLVEEERKFEDKQKQLEVMCRKCLQCLLLFVSIIYFPLFCFL